MNYTMLVEKNKIHKALKKKKKDLGHYIFSKTIDTKIKRSHNQMQSLMDHTINQFQIKNQNSLPKFF